MNSFKSDHRVH